MEEQGRKGTARHRLLKEGSVWAQEGQMEVAEGQMEVAEGQMEEVLVRLLHQTQDKAQTEIRKQGASLRPSRR